MGLIRSSNRRNETGAIKETYEKYIQKEYLLDGFDATKDNLYMKNLTQKSYIEDVRNRLNTGFNEDDVSADTSETPKIVYFSQNKKAQNH